MCVHKDPQRVSADVRTSQWSKGGIKSQQKIIFSCPSSMNLLPLFHHLEDVLWTASLVVVTGLYWRHPSLLQPLCNQCQVFERRVAQVGDALRDSKSNLPFIFLIQNPVQLEIAKPNLQPFSGKSIEFHECNLYTNLILGPILLCYLSSPIVSVSSDRY